MNANTTKTVVTLTRCEYAVDAPISAVEMSKVIAVVGAEARDHLGSIDDTTVQIKSYDDGIVLFWTYENRT